MRMGKSATTSIMAGLALMILAHSPAAASPMNSHDHKPLAHFATHDAASTEKISHKNWERVLSIMFVKDEKSGKPILDYGRLSPRARGVLKGYVRSMQNVAISTYNKNEQLAYWLNFYNAASFNLVYEALDDMSSKMSSASRNPSPIKFTLNTDNEIAKRRYYPTNLPCGSIQQNTSSGCNI